MRPELISGGNAPKSNTVPLLSVGRDRIAHSKDQVVKTSSHLALLAPVDPVKSLTDSDLRPANPVGGTPEHHRAPLRLVRIGGPPSRFPDSGQGRRAQSVSIAPLSATERQLVSG